jgi:hypothetical protein
LNTPKTIPPHFDRCLVSTHHPSRASHPAWSDPAEC